MLPTQCGHTRDFRTHQEDGTALCACGATFSTDGTLRLPKASLCSSCGNWITPVSPLTAHSAKCKRS